MLSAATPGAARASSPAELEAARMAFTEGLALENGERWAEALERFERAAGVRASPQILFHRGLCLEHLGRFVEALDAFAQAEREARADGAARRVGALAAEHLAHLRERVGALVLHAPEGVALRVQLDGKDVAPAAFEMSLPVDPGTHRLSVEGDGFARKDTTVLVQAGEHRETRLEPGAALPSTPPRVAPAPTPSSPVLPLVVGGVAVGAFVTAGVFYGLRASAIGELEAGCAGQPFCPNALRAVRDRGEAYTTAGNVALGLGIAATAAAIVTLFVVRPVTVTARGSALVVQGAF